MNAITTDLKAPSEEFLAKGLDDCHAEEELALMPSIATLQRCGLLDGASSRMRSLFRMLERVAPTCATVLIVGESGTGKELVARSIHDLGNQQKAPFVAINCGALPAGLIESELFGFERGSFTGADRQHRGMFERAEGGTLFLDEITEMAIELQVKLLRVLETGRFTRVGGTQDIKVNVRLIAATNRSPAEAVAQCKLRQDLLYRLAVFPIDVPPLRDRGDDIVLLAQQFLDRLNTESSVKKVFAGSAAAALRRHAWPGNVRELKNLIERAFILYDKELELEKLLQQPVAPPQVVDGNSIRITVGTPLAEAERELILATLNHCSGSKRHAAEVLGLSLKTLYNRLHEYQIALPNDPANDLASGAVTASDSSGTTGARTYYRSTESTPSWRPFA